MDRLWAPWRMKYIHAKKVKGCVFCMGAKSKKKDYVIIKSPYSISLLNIFPYNNGHMMVSPKRHISRISQLKDHEFADLFHTINRTTALLDKVLKPDGYNIGINISRTAGAGIVGHLHVHIVPRWNGDTNFMPALCGTKVISQSLKDLHKRLAHAKSKTDKRIRR